MKTPYVLVLSAVILSACSSSPDTVRYVEPNEPDVPQSSGYDNTLTMEPFEFTLPAGWVAEDGSNEVKIRVPDENYEVYLLMSLEESSTLPGAEDEVVSTDEGIQIFSVGCGGAFDCGNLAYDGQGYQYGFQVESDQPVPENLDGIWTPDTEVTQDDIAAFIATVHLAK